MKHKLNLSYLKYLEYRDSEGNSVIKWILNYFERNNIFYQYSDTHLIITFKSENQLVWFDRKCNQVFPFVEIL